MNYMENVEAISETTNKVVSVTCDKCSETYSMDDPIGRLEIEEFLRYKDTCGYGAMYDPVGENCYADGDTISVDLCQYCKKELLGPYIKVIADA